MSAEWFAFDQQRQPVQPLGSPFVEYPDYWGYTLLDYGTRVGLPRVMEALASRQLRVTMAVNAEVCRRYPSIVRRAVKLGWELIGHGTTSSRLIHEAMPAAEEAELIGESLSIVQRAAGRPVRGWLSPSLSESTRTPDLLADAGVRYLCDWVNDDLPYRLRTATGSLHSLPYSHELSDLHVIQELHQTAGEFRDGLIAAMQTLRQEAVAYGGRCLCVAVHPWLIGAPHRIRYLGEALDQIVSADPASVWSATGSEILDAFASQARAQE